MVAAGFAYSQAAGIIATIVKLTRTTLIIPLVIGFGLAMPWLDPTATHGEVSLARRVYKAVPTFILLFVAASVLNSLGLFGPLRARRATAGPLGDGGGAGGGGFAGALARLRRRRGQAG